MSEARPFDAVLAHPILQRLKRFVVSPEAEWTAIAAEPATQQDLFLKWILPFSAFFLIAGQVGSMAHPVSVLGVSSAPSVAQALITVVVGLPLMAASVWVLAQIVEFVSPRLGGRADPIAALKLVAYALTPFWLSTAFSLLPALWPLSLLGFYGVWLFYVGVPILTGTPAAHRLTHVAAVAASAAVLALIAVTVSGCFHLARAADPGRLPPAHEVLAREATVEHQLLMMLPEALPGGWTRVERGFNNGGALSFTGVTAEAHYRRDAHTLTLDLVDLADGAEAAQARARGLYPAEESGSRYTRVAPEGFPFALERWDALSGEAARISVHGGRIALIARGRGASPEDLARAVRLLDEKRLERLAKAP